MEWKALAAPWLPHDLPVLAALTLLLAATVVYAALFGRRRVTLVSADE